MSDDGRQQDPDYWSARLALLSVRLQADSSGRSARNEVVLLPSEDAVAEEQAASAMAAQDKPVRCRGLVVSGMLTVECKPLMGPAIADYRVSRDVLGRDTAEEFRRLYCRHESNPQFLVRSTVTIMVVPLVALAHFLRDYEVPVALHAEPPDDLARSRGACAVVVLYAPGDVSIDDPLDL